MVEDIGKIISNGFETYTKNLNLCIPFALNVFISVLVAVFIIIFGFTGIFGSSLSDLGDVNSPEAFASILLPLLTQHLMEIALMLLILLLVISFIQAYFTSGGIGMAIQATESGKSSLTTMRGAGKKNFLNMFLAEMLFGLLSLAGVVFIVPGAMRIDISQIFTSENTGAIALLSGGFFLWIIYSVILSLIFALFRYALVADNLGPLESMTASMSFFNKNKSDVFLLFIFIIIIGIGLFIIDRIIGSIPIINIIWSFINLLISLFIIPPLTAIWWVRLYMDRTGRKLHIDDLLAHPDELKEVKSYY